ncbi:unnamed protein product [Rotaria sp. Silwood2]|nr:unnamed protein product [Rotaria sp. Silwood2]
MLTQIPVSTQKATGTEALRKRANSYSTIQCNEYNRSMLIFDIDSLIMLGVSDSAMSKSVSISNIHLYQFIREKCKKAVVEQSSTDGKEKKTSGEHLKEKWVVMIVKHPLLYSLLVNDIEFKKTLRQTQQEHEDEQKRIDDETLKLCPKCQHSYIPSQVNHGSCHYHDGYIVDLDNPSKILTQDEAQRITQNARIQATANQDSNVKTPMPKLIWACCLSFFGTEQPCKVGICGLPGELDESVGDSNTDLITKVQEHFKKNQAAKKKIEEFIEYYKKSKGAQRPVPTLTTNTPTRPTSAAPSVTRRN